MQEAGKQAYEVEGERKQFLEIIKELQEWPENKADEIEKIKERQKWPENDDGQEIHFDIDSSPKAWDHYRQYYFLDEGGLSTCFRDSYDSEHLRLGAYIKPVYNNGECIKPGYYKDSPKGSNNRLYALSNEVAGSVQPKELAKGGSYPFAWRLGGECDFNFSNKEKSVLNKKTRKWETRPSNKKCFEDRLEEDKNITEEVKKAAKERLERYSRIHHTPANFSLMFVPGNMQRFKGNGIFKEEEMRYEHLDRLDTLVFYIDKFFKGDPQIVLPEDDENCDNEKALRDYLKGFGDIYDYCRQVYFIDDADVNNRIFVNKLIDNGRKPIETGEDVIRYMDLANEFWNKKIGYFLSRPSSIEGGA